jgi:lipopolysaccharide biosynthesis glycosyltransferase
MEKYKEVIPIFFAVDDGYIPFLAVTLQSIVEKSKEEYYYVVKILYTNISEENKEKINKYKRENIEIEFVNLNYYIEKVKDKLYTRDYFSMTTYFRLFISNLYPQYNKAIYLDSDIVLLTDVAELYMQDIGDNLVGAVADDIIQQNEVFQEYVEKVVGVASYKTYFNAGMLIMNLDELRKTDFQGKFLYLLETVKYSVVQDQDYLNRICKGRVKLLDKSWNVMPNATKDINEADIKLIHYNYQYKPWHYDNIPYAKYFWDLAKKTEFYNKLAEVKENFTDEMKYQDRVADTKLRELAKKETDCVGDDRAYIKSNIEEKKHRDYKKYLLPKRYRNSVIESQSREEVYERIRDLEKNGIFDLDVEQDPPTIPLTPENVDYLREKGLNRIKNVLANRMGEKYLKDLIKNKKLIIKDIKGLENLENVKTGAMITCNHFNPNDFLTIEQVFRKTNQIKTKKLYKVIREGNYTNFPGFPGFLFRNGDTLPLSANTSTMIEFMKAVDTILQRGEFILIYPEQSMWWNYRKPKPLKIGAYKMAAKNNVPVIPIFITMEDSEIIGDDGEPVQEYTVNIAKPIYPDENLSIKENTEKMREENAKVWKEIYEDFYKIPLEYTTIKEDKETVNE